MTEPRRSEPSDPLTTRVIGAADIAEMLRIVGRDQFMDLMIEENLEVETFFPKDDNLQAVFQYLVS